MNAESGNWKGKWKRNSNFLHESPEHGFLTLIRNYCYQICHCIICSSYSSDVFFNFILSNLVSRISFNISDLKPLQYLKYNTCIILHLFLNEKKLYMYQTIKKKQPFFIAKYSNYLYYVSYYMYYWTESFISLIHIHCDICVWKFPSVRMLY